MRAAADWLARVVMLVLAGLVTLSIIGSIAAIPSGTIGERLTFAERASEPVPLDTEPEASQSPIPERERELAGSSSSEGLVASTKAEERDPARWLEAITYALLALTGILALATFVLWRILKQVARIANRR